MCAEPELVGTSLECTQEAGCVCRRFNLVRRDGIDFDKFYGHGNIDTYIAFTAVLAKWLA